MSLDRQVNSPERQRQGFAEYCQRFALTPVGEYLEEAVSATSTALADRPALANLVAAAKRRLFDLVWVEEPSRLARRPEDWFAVRAALGRYSVAIVGPGDDPTAAHDTSIAEFTQGLFALLARFEARQFGDRVNRAQRLKVAAGHYRGGPLPPGLQWENGTTSPSGVAQWALDPDRQPIAELTFRVFLETHSLEATAAALNAAGYHTRNGRGFGAKAAHDILRSPAYRGRVSYAGEEWPADLPEIVDPALVAEVDVLLGRQFPHNFRADTSRHATFAGLLRCHECGGVLTTSMDRRRRKDGEWGVMRVRYFCCRGWRQPLLCTNRHYISEHRLDRELLPAIVAGLRKRLDEPGEFEQPRRRDGQRKRLEEERARVVGLHVRGRISAEECDRLLVSVAERLAALGKGSGAQGRPPTRKDLVAALQALEKNWQVWAPTERRALLQTVLEGVTLDVGTPSESTIHWRV